MRGREDGRKEGRRGLRGRLEGLLAIGRVSERASPHLRSSTANPIHVPLLSPFPLVPVVFAPHLHSVLSFLFSSAYIAQTLYIPWHASRLLCSISYLQRHACTLYFTRPRAQFMSTFRTKLNELSI